MSRTTEEVDWRTENEMRQARRATREKEECNQRKDEGRRARERRAMDRATLMLALLPMTGHRRAVGIAEADLETRRTCVYRKLRCDRARQNCMEDERIGGDPADQLAPKLRS